MSPFGPASTAANPGYGDDHSRNSRPLASPNEWPPSALGQSPEIAGNGVAAAHPVVIQWNEGGREEEKVETISQKAVLQAQKHCRFAISSLDYEDIEQARKELRAALALLE
jgi:vacuolar protein sorting-associated protein VTA1